MNLRNRWLAAVLCVAPLGAAWGVTADEIIAKHVAARGGAEQMHALRSLERKGKLLIPGFNIELTVRELRARPSGFRQEVTLQGLTQIVAWDGKDAWQVQPFEGRKDPARMSDDEANGLRLGADLDGPLVDYRAKGHQVEYLGSEDVDGTPAHKLRVRLAWGDEVTYWIDPDSWMVIRDRQKQSVRGAEQVVDTDYGEYEKVGGVYVPMTEESGPKDSDPSQRQKIVYDTAAANVPADASAFAFPAPKR
jgi:hypothetical protein